MKNILFLAALICGAELFAVDPVAVWNGDFTTTTKGDYTLVANGNTVAADGSSITISAAKGVTFERSSALANTVGMTVVCKFDNLVVGSTVKTIGTASAGGGNADRIGVNVQTSGQTSGIWANTGTYNTSATQTTVSSVENNGQFALVYGPSVSNNSGTFLYLKNGSADYALAYSCGGLKGSSDTVQAMTVGGTRNNGGTFPAASGMVIKAVALFDQALTQAQIAEYVFPEPTKKVEPVMLVNFGYATAEAGWYNHTQSGGNSIGTLTTNNVSFLATKNVGNFFNVSNSDFGQVNTDWTADGTYTDIFGKTFTTVAEEVKSSLGLGSIPFTANVYKTGLMNGGYTDHEVTISGLDATAKYVVYAGFGMLRTQYNEQVMGVQFDASGYATVEALEYIVTVAGTGTTKESRYQSFAAGTQICPGTHGLMLTRLVNVQPKADGAIALTFKGAKGGINFLAVAKVNEATVYTTKEIAGGATISVSAINAEIEETNDKVEVTLPDGAVVTYDAALAVPTKFISSGAITLTHETQPDLDKADFSGVTGTLLRTWMTRGIGFNFAAGCGPKTDKALVGDTDWYDNAKNATATDFRFGDGLMKITYSSANIYNDAGNKDDDVNGTLVKGYLDDGNGVKITVKGIPYREYAVVVYASTDDPNNPYLTYKTVNGKNYTYDPDHPDIAKIGTARWGEGRKSAAPAYGTNAIRVIAQTEGTLTIASPRDTDNQSRGCISAIQIVPYMTAVAPSLVEGKTVEVAVETDAETYAGGRVTLTIPEGAVDLGTYTEDQVSYKIVFAGKVDAVAGEKQKDGTVAFVLPDTEYVAGHVYRGQVVLDYGEGETPLGSVAVYEGERQYKWIASPFVIKEKTTIDDAQGCTINPVFDSPDYVENCDSRYTVSISAREAIDESLDEPLAGNEQGGVRIVQMAGGLKLQGLVKPEDGASAWTNLADAELDKEYVVTVTFHYTKDFEGEREPTSVSYQLGETNVSGVNPTAKLNVSEIFISDGTKLPSDLLGACQLDVAVIVDLEIEPGDELLGLGETEEAAEAAAAKLKVGIGEAVRKVLTTAEAQENYRAYFKVAAVKTDLGYVAQVVFKPEVESEIETELEKELENVVAAFNAGSDAEIAAKPGLYYGVKRGDALNDMSVRDSLTLAGADGKVTITITKPEKSNGHFYRLICTPTPAKEK